MRIAMFQLLAASFLTPLRPAVPAGADLDHPVRHLSIQATRKSKTTQEINMKLLDLLISILRFAAGVSALSRDEPAERLLDLNRSAAAASATIIATKWR
jgi:hypothetical protein